MSHIITIHNVDKRFMDFYGDHLARTSKLRWRLTLDGSDVKVYAVCSAGVSAAAYQYSNRQPAQSSHIPITNSREFVFQHNTILLPRSVSSAIRALSLDADILIEQL